MATVLDHNFSSCNAYLIVISGVSLPHCRLWLHSNQFELLQSKKTIGFYQIQKQFKDQAQLISFIQEVYNNRFSIVSITQKSKFKLSHNEK